MRKPVPPILPPQQASGPAPGPATGRGSSEAFVASGSAGTAAAAVGGSRLVAEPSMSKPPAQHTVSGRVVQTSDYCGGVAPPEELLESLRKEKPFPNKVLHIRPGSVNKASQAVLRSFAADAGGSFKIKLPPGEYCVVEEDKKTELKLGAVANENPREAESRADCLRKWYSTCDKVLKVGDQDLKDVVIKFHHTCHPPCAPPGPPVP